MIAVAEDAGLQDEVEGLLSRLIQADTSNPPGDVTAAARVPEQYFRNNGVEPTLIGELPELPNCIARLASEGEGPSLLMLGHLDVVPAEATDWAQPPFSGLVKDGYMWGRGALDMKNQLAAPAVAFVHLARRADAGEKLRGDLVFAATADEETGERCGAKWLRENSPDLVRTDFVISEGGMDMFEVGDRHLYTIHAGEKATPPVASPPTGAPVTVPCRCTMTTRSTAWRTSSQPLSDTSPRCRRSAFRPPSSIGPSPTPACVNA